MKPDKKQRAAVAMMSAFSGMQGDVLVACHLFVCGVTYGVGQGEGELLEMLLIQLSTRAKEAARYDALFPVLQMIHDRLARSQAEPTVAGATQRNLRKAMSRMSCQQMIYFMQKNPNLDSDFMQNLREQMRGSCQATVVFEASSVWL